MLLYSCTNFTAKNSDVISILTSKDHLIYIHNICEAHQEKNYFYRELIKNDAIFFENKWNKLWNSLPSIVQNNLNRGLKSFKRSMKMFLLDQL